MADFIKIAEEAFATGKQHPAFKAGDTITVAYKIVEGNNSSDLFLAWFGSYVFTPFLRLQTL